MKLLRAAAPEVLAHCAGGGPLPATEKLGDEAAELDIVRLNSPARALSHPPRRQTGSLGCSGPAPEEVDGSVRPPFLHRERGLVPKTRALSHYSGEPSRKGSITRT